MQSLSSKLRCFFLVFGLFFSLFTHLEGKVVAIGDSHSAASFTGISDCTVHWIGPRTLFRVGRDGIEGLNVKDYGVEENDTVVFVFGEIDVRCHLLKQRDLQQIPTELLIKLMVKKYISTLLLNKLQFNCLHVVIFCVLPPTDAAFNPEYPIYGSLQDRIEVTKLLNQELIQSAYENNIYTINVYDAYANHFGAFDANKSDGNVHIGRGHNAPVADALHALLQKIYRITP
jgi:hypothetical protein